MKSEKNFSSELAKSLRKKAIRKYALIVLVAIISVSVILGINIEDKDSKLPDGQGNIVTNEEVLQDGKDSLDIKDNEKLSSGEILDNVVSGDEEEIIDDSPEAEKPEIDSSIHRDESSIDKEVIKDKPSVESNTTSKPSTDKEVTTSKPSADKETTTDKPSEEKKPTAEDLAVDNSDDPTASNGGNSAYKPEEAESVTVTIRISCNTLSSDMSKLTNEAIKEYIPSNGVILGTTTYKGTTDNTVFDVLNTVCRNNGIHLESSYTPMYESYYVEGINYIYEFDGGAGSGWMYKVNGWFPNYGCSSYYLSDGDVIEWVYTCDYGADVGGTMY